LGTIIRTGRLGYADADSAAAAMPPAASAGSASTSARRWTYLIKILLVLLSADAAVTSAILAGVRYAIKG
jgi:hypothetical protein